MVVKLKGWNSMWGRKSRIIKRMRQVIDGHANELARVNAEIYNCRLDRFIADTGKPEPIPELVECETCGCAVFKGSAVKGKSELRTRTFLVLCFPSTQEYIHHPYYCKVHDPNKKPEVGEFIKEKKK